MFIINQVGNVVVNLENLSALYFEECVDCFDVVVKTVTNSRFYIGSYETEERVQEIFDDIIDNYLIGEKVYIMPMI